MQRPQSTPPTEMSSCVFSDRFNTLPSSASALLSHEYSQNNGRLPSRPRLRQLSLELAVSQARIKKWFQERADQEEREKRRERLKWAVESKKERNLQELRDRLEEIEVLLSKFEIHFQ